MPTELRYEIKHSNCDLCKDKDDTLVLALYMDDEWEDRTFEVDLCLDHFREFMYKAEKELDKRLYERWWNS